MELKPRLSINNGKVGLKMSIYHHGTIRKYTAALLNIFNELEIQYNDSNGVLHSKNVPVKYSTKEKSMEFDKYTTEQLLDGNYNVLPRANIALSQMVKSEQRVRNKNLKMNKVENENSFDFLYNSVPYEFNYDLVVLCRGMNEACMIVEQIVPRFNPTYEVDIYDASNLDEPTRIPVKLLDVSIESQEYDELSSNIITVSFGLSLTGNLYPPIKSIQKIKEVKMSINDGFDNRKTMFGWDVVETVMTNETLTQNETNYDNPPSIIDIVVDGVAVVGTNALEVIYDDKDNVITELTFEWVVLSGDASISYDKEFGTLIVNSVGDVEVEVTITDKYGNFDTVSKLFTI